MSVVVGLGGNALLRRGEPPTGEAQRRKVCAGGGGIPIVFGAPDEAPTGTRP